LEARAFPEKFLQFFCLLRFVHGLIEFPFRCSVYRLR